MQRYSQEDKNAGAIRRFCSQNPFFLPLLAVVGSLPGGQWWCLTLVAIVTGVLLRLHRILLCSLLCVGIAFVQTELQRYHAEKLHAELAAKDAVELVGTVERRLAKGCIINTGITGARVVVRGNTPWFTGARVRVVAQEQPLREPLVKGMFDTKAWLRSQGLAANMQLLRGEYLGVSYSWYTVLGAAEAVRDFLSERIAPRGSTPNEAQQVLCSLALGDKERAESATLHLFKKAGCLHAFAVSGLHVGIVAGLLYFMAALAKLSPGVRTVLVLVVVGLYVLITGFAVPAMRAYFMIALVLLAMALRRRVNGVNIWCFAALVVLLLHPWQWNNAGFVLSFAVYAGIGIGVKWCMKDSPWLAPNDYIPHRLYTPAQRYMGRLDAGLRGAVLVSLSAWLVSAPITMHYFHTITPYSYLVNIAIAPLLPLVMGSGLLAALLSGIPWVGPAMLWFAEQCAGVLLAVVGFFAGLPMSYLPTSAPPQSVDSAMVCSMGYGDSFTVLGNPGLLLGCGKESDVFFCTEPALFFGGYTPVVLLAGSSDSGADSLQKSIPNLQVLPLHSLEHIVRIENAVGKFTIYPPFPHASRRSKENATPIVLWECAEQRVLYVGDASALTLANVPTQDIERADWIIMGYNPHFPADIGQFIRENGGQRVILLPSAAADEPELPPGVELLRVNDKEPVHRFNVQPSAHR